MIPPSEIWERILREIFTAEEIDRLRWYCLREVFNTLNYIYYENRAKFSDYIVAYDSLKGLADMKPDLTELTELLDDLRPFPTWKSLMDNFKTTVEEWKEDFDDWKPSIDDMKIIFYSWKDAISDWKVDIDEWKDGVDDFMHTFETEHKTEIEKAYEFASTFRDAVTTPFDIMKTKFYTISTKFETAREKFEAITTKLTELSTGITTNIVPAFHSLAGSDHFLTLISKMDTLDTVFTDFAREFRVMIDECIGVPFGVAQLTTEDYSVVGGPRGWWKPRYPYSILGCLASFIDDLLTGGIDRVKGWEIKEIAGIRFIKLDPDWFPVWLSDFINTALPLVINHWHAKLDMVITKITNIGDEFSGNIKDCIINIKDRFAGLKLHFESMATKFTEIVRELTDIKTAMADLKAEFEGLRDAIESLKGAIPDPK